MSEPMNDNISSLDYFLPIVIDLNNNGVRLISLTDSNAFYKVVPTATERLRTGWLSPYDALFVYDANGDGVISEANELNFRSYVPNATSDLEGLVAFDSNGDGKISALDEKWSQFYLWQDFNGNGLQETGELFTPKSKELRSVSLTKKPGYTDISGNLVRNTGTAEFWGGTAELADVGFGYDPNDPWRANMDDLLTASASGSTLSGGAGNDTLQGGSGPDELWGEAGDDSVLGGDGNDDLNGNVGNDFLGGGAGNDTLWGGAGDDTIEGNEGDDVVNAYTENDYVYGGDGNDTLYGGAGDDGISGGNGDDLIHGGTGRDLLYGDDGNDVLNGDADADNSLGGLGNDIHVVQNSDDFAFENANQGIDTVIASGNYKLQNNIEVLILGTEAHLTGTGNDEANTLYGTQGDNTLDGGKGADTLIGGAGNDTYKIDNAQDVIIEQADGWVSTFSGDYFENGVLKSNFFNLYGHPQFTGTHWGIDTVITSVSYTLPENVENLTLVSYSAATLVGNASDNTITAGDGDTNKLTGGKGNDTLIGGMRNDEYLFSLGDGQDVVEDKAPNSMVISPLPIVDKFRFGPGIVPSSVVAVQEGNDARISYGTRGDTILVKNWYGDGRIERLLFSDGDSTTPYMLSLFVNHPPIPTQAIADKRIALRESFQWVLPSDLFRDLENQAITLSVMQQDGSALPAWLSYDSSNRTLQGSSTTTGTFKLRIKTTDIKGWSGYLDFDLSVTDAPAPSAPAPAPSAPAPAPSAPAPAPSTPAPAPSAPAPAPSSPAPAPSSPAPAPSSPAPAPSAPAPAPSAPAPAPSSPAPAPSAPAPAPSAPASAPAPSLVATTNNDTLTGSSADDVIAGKGGNDLLNGQAGNDTLVGGLGNDSLNGGDGHDLLIGGQGDAGQWQIEQTAAGELRLSFTPDAAAWVEVGGFSIKSHFPPNTVSVLDGHFTFADGSAELRATISNFYLVLAKRLPELSELNAWITQEWDADRLSQQVADTLLTGLGKEASTAQKLNGLLDTVLGNGQATPTLMQAGLDYLSAGGTWGHLLQLLAQHSPARQQHTNANGEMTLTQASTWTDTGWGAGDGDDLLTGGAGNDTLVGGGGNDLLNGGDGTDTAVWAGRVQDFKVTIVGTGADAKVALMDTRLGTTDTLQSIELLSIGGQSLNAAPLQSVDAVRNYLATHSDVHLEVVLIGLGG